MKSIAYKPTKIVMLPTDDKAKEGDLILSSIRYLGLTIANRRILGNLYFEDIDYWKSYHTRTDDNIDIKVNHLYFLSDDTYFSTSDWVIEDNELKLFNSKRNPKNCVKVIATTRTDVDLPKIPESFIEKYIKFFKNDNIIEECLVKYEQYVTEGWIPTYNNPDNHNLEPMAEISYRPKITDGAINIKVSMNAFDDELLVTEEPKVIIYTEKEVKQLFEKWFGVKIKEELMKINGEMDIIGGVSFEEWFDKNKK